MLNERSTSKKECADSTTSPAINFSDPSSVVRFAPTTGIFASNEFLKDREGFVSRVLGKWYNVKGNTLTIEPETHENEAEALFDLYVDIRSNAAKLSRTGLGLILGTLNKTGSIDKARKILRAAISED
ncbi:hypothetical protein [Marinobacter sp.]|uniref:hypothetical protein n=1 Tax=Marinobacter sp. TaxID=50741 RepID=UPI0026156FF9|nr:hypothetical protein [Marinobacter sp.]